MGLLCVAGIATAADGLASPHGLAHFDLHRALLKVPVFAELGRAVLQNHEVARLVLHGRPEGRQVGRPVPGPHHLAFGRSQNLAPEARVLLQPPALLQRHRRDRLSGNKVEGVGRVPGVRLVAIHPLHHAPHARKRQRQLRLLLGRRGERDIARWGFLAALVCRVSGGSQLGQAHHPHQGSVAWQAHKVSPQAPCGHQQSIRTHRCNLSTPQRSFS